LAKITIEKMTKITRKWAKEKVDILTQKKLAKKVEENGKNNQTYGFKTRLKMTKRNFFIFYLENGISNKRQIDLTTYRSNLLF
jgi:hypothetical protein